MTDFFKNIWSDLREKGLWPVAVVLLIAIVAVPVVLAKSSTTPPPSDDAVVAETSERRTAVALDTGSAAASGAGSSLEVFGPDDPFAPPSGIAREATADVEVASAAGAGETVDVQVGGGGTVDETIDVTPLAPRTETRTKTRTETTSYEYVADISFWQGERRKRMNGLRKLDMLPNESAPLLIFMGATGDGGNATFLVDSTVTTAGEGNCRPAASNCAFVDIGPGAEHVFTTEEGESFRLRVEEIRRVKVTAKSSANQGPSGRASVGQGSAARRFTLPSLIDLVEVDTTDTTTTTTVDSSKAVEGR
ncbi:MAG TPA: hypothetical protein VEW67_04375 [Thermoleophilaceae bacterium]|nr:hypothetical protein [Thermoleophilaceae bacterium]